MDERVEVQSVDIDKAGGTMRVVFGDGHECRFELTDLRRQCPCAGCRGARDQGRPVAPDAGPALELADASLHGAWGLSVTWADGHAAGIYPWDGLRRWCDDGHPSLTNDGPGRPAPT